MEELRAGHLSDLFWFSSTRLYLPGSVMKALGTICCPEVFKAKTCLRIVSLTYNFIFLWMCNYKSYSCADRNSWYLSMSSLINFIPPIRSAYYTPKATSSFIGFIMALFYEDEDQILPLLLHRVEPGMPECSCRDCQGIRERMRQLSLEPAQFSNHMVAWSRCL